MDVTEEIKALVKKAAEAEKADDAMKFSQAATNAANAMACVSNIRKETDKK